MTMECRPSNLSSDVRCKVCGQGFLLYGDRRASQQRAAIRQSVQELLRSQHNRSHHAPEGFLFHWAAEPAMQS